MASREWRTSVSQPVGLAAFLAQAHENSAVDERRARSGGGGNGDDDGDRDRDDDCDGDCYRVATATTTRSRGFSLCN